MTRVLALLLLVASYPLGADEPLHLSQVLEAAAMTHPKLVEAQAAIEQQCGAETAATKVFEPKLKADSLGLPEGFYQYFRLATYIEQTIPVGGVSIAAGYRRSDGDVPPYYQEYVTRDGGEAFAKISIPLLMGSTIDKGRAKIRKARLGVEASTQELAFTWMTVARDTTLAYWNWVAAGQQLRLARSLLEIAKERAEWIDQQIANGAVARIVAVDNNGVLLARQAKMIKAEEKFNEAQNKLSLYYRDCDGEPVVADLQAVPNTIATLPEESDEFAQWAEEALCHRPDLKALEIAEQAAEVDLKLANNLRLPQVDLLTYVARDIGPGKASLGETDVGVGLKVSAPLFQREARGKRRKAQAKLQAIQAKQKALQDQIEMDIRQLRRTAALSQQRLDLASGRLQATEKLADAERLRLKEGATDVLTVNLRELAINAAALDAIEAQLDLHTSLAHLLFTVGGTVR